MSNLRITRRISGWVIIVTASSAMADVTITQQAGPAPTYGTTLNFDEPGGPTGTNIASDAWLGTHDALIAGGDGIGRVDDWDPVFGGFGLGDANSFFGNFGVFINFNNDVTEMSFQAWDPSGPATPFGGGLNIATYKDGTQTQFLAITPAWGGIGDTWLDIVASPDMAFDEIRIWSTGFSPTTFVDNMSWNAVPAPSSVALLGLAGLMVRRRR